MLVDKPFLWDNSFLALDGIIIAKSFYKGFDFLNEKSLIENFYNDFIYAPYSNSNKGNLQKSISFISEISKADTKVLIKFTNPGEYILFFVSDTKILIIGLYSILGKF